MNIFTQQVNFGDIAVNQEVSKICREHPECIGCPMKNDDIKIQNTTVRCETGRAKGRD